MESMSEILVSKACVTVHRHKSSSFERCFCQEKYSSNVCTWIKHSLAWLRTMETCTFPRLDSKEWFPCLQYFGTTLDGEPDWICAKNTILTVWESSTEGNLVSVRDIRNIASSGKNYHLFGLGRCRGHESAKWSIVRKHAVPRKGITLYSASEFAIPKKKHMLQSKWKKTWTLTYSGSFISMTYYRDVHYIKLDITGTILVKCARLSGP